MSIKTHTHTDPFRSQDALLGKTAVVTGAGRGIGKAIALALAWEGANVACVARTATEIEEVASTINSRFKGRALAIVGDISNPSAASNVHARVLENLGAVYILINNAGINKINPLEHEPNFESWWRVIEVNLRGPVALIHEILPSMLSRGQGIIISIGSRNAIVDMPFVTAYSASKTALLKFHQCLELEIRGRGVYHYVVQPGDVPTTMTHQKDVIDFETIEKVPGLRRMLESSIGKSVTPPELAASTCVMLATNEEARILSGLYVDAEQDLECMIRVMRGEIETISNREYLYKLSMEQLDFSRS